MANDDSRETARLHQAEENLELLQTQVDELHSDNRALRRRVEHLHGDRESLRSRNYELKLRLHQQTSKWISRFRAAVAGLIRRQLTPRKALLTLVNRPSQPAAPERDLVAFAPASAPLAHSTLIPETTFPTNTPRLALRVAAVMDNFSRAAFSPEFEYVSITPQNWRAELSTPPDLLFVESAFAGNQGKWVNQIAGFCPPRQALAELTDWCRSQGIPTVFWNKEDPANFEWFIGAASAFDWVFTVDVESIPRYVAELGHNRIGALPFAAQPNIHFPPPAAAERDGAVAFAGSYYAKKHAERRRQMEIVLQPALDYGLDLFDRMGNLDDPRFAWPEMYRSHIRGSLSYPQTTEAYRRYKVFLNVNTVTTSPTMCARRVFELLASGTAVISGPAEALTAMVPADAILISSSAEQTRELLDEVLQSERKRNSLASAGSRWITAGNTYTHRVTQMLEEIGLKR